MAAISKIKVNGTAYDLQDVGAARTSHSHGSITSAGAITGTTALANGDGLIFADSSDSSKLKRSSITIGTGTTTFLRNDGTWAAPPSGGLTGVTVGGSSGNRGYYFDDTFDDNWYSLPGKASIRATNSWYDGYTDWTYSALRIQSTENYDPGFSSEMGHSEIGIWQSINGDPTYHGISIEHVRNYGSGRSVLYIGYPVEQAAEYMYGVPYSGGWTIGSISGDGFCGIHGDAYSNDAYFTHPYAGTITMSQLIMHVGGCVMEGTKITMADGSLKSVEQVRVGDRIKSYDFKTGEYTEAVVLLNVNQGSSNKFDCNMFANGKTLYTYDVHRVVSDSLENPIPKTTELETGDMVYMADMKRSKFEGTIEYKDNVRKKYYHLISSSGIYFTDGIMSANHPTDKVSVFTQNDIHVDDRLKDQWDIDAVYNKKNKIENPEFIRKSHKLLGEIKVLSRTIEDAKANLISTDYLNLKHSEGLLDEDAWEQVKTQREAWRQIINVSEGPLEEKNAAMEALREEYGIAPDMKISRRQQFYDSVSGNNALIDVYKEFRKDPAERDAELARKAEEKKIKKLEVTEDEKTEGADS